MVPESVMPNYPWFLTRGIDGNGVASHMRAMKAIGVPYTDADIERAPAEVRGKVEMDAIVAYLQVLGTMATLDDRVDYRE
jgi:cytochrome c oxidase cbb3-type subunit 2